MYNRRRTMTELYRESMVSRTKTNYLRPGLQKVRAEDDEIILRFMSQKDLPDWFRGTSIFQMEATDALLNALRDDAEQNTVHRVRTCLRRIGIEPLISTQETKLLMRLARGNDLAFLWFLRELHYQSDGPGYSINEQLIYSAICHLDMVTTLRELDRILPPPQPSKRKLSQLNQKDKTDEKNKRKDKEFRKKWLEWKRAGLSPYFEPIPTPRTNTIVLSATKPLFRMSFTPYDVYKNPSYIVPNEFNRWFADYQLQPSKRIAHLIIDEEIKNIFGSTGAPAHPKHDDVKPLCGHHKHLAKLEKNLETELKIIARDHCLKLESEEEQDRAESVRNQLHREIDCYMAQFRKMTDKMRKRCSSSSVCNDTQLAYIVRDVFDFSCLPLDSDTVSEHESGEDQACGDTKNMNVLMGKPAANGIGKERKDIVRLVGGGGDGYDLNYWCSRCKFHKIRTRSNHKASSFVRVFPDNTKCSGSSNSRVNNYEYGHADQGTPTTSHKYFHAPATHRPYKFDYRKIFRLQKKKSVGGVDVAHAFAEAVDSHMHMLDLLKDESDPPNMDATVHNSANRIWKETVTCKSTNGKTGVDPGSERNSPLNEREGKEEHDNSTDTLGSVNMESSKIPPQDKESPLEYNADYYDPDDLNLMQKMLKDALDYMKKNPKFVLASMPDAHKLPGLTLWMCDRYGKRFDENELSDSLKTSFKIWKALNKVCADQPMPGLCNIAHQNLLDYSNHDDVMRKGEEIKKDYFGETNDIVMEQARVFWFAFQPYLCAGGPPRETYYAYMPARVKDVSQGSIRPWRPYEFMKAAVAWDARQQQKRRDEMIMPLP